jgi:hypothetical protein
MPEAQRQFASIRQQCSLLTQQENRLPDELPVF